MRQVLAFVTAAALTGCSLIYNPSNIDPSHSEPPADAEIILDADPSMLMVTGVNPPMILEGQGDGGSVPALVVIDGHNMVADGLAVTLAPIDSTPPQPAGAVPKLGVPIVAKDGNWIAIPVTALVDPTLPAGAKIQFDVQVTENVPGGGTSTAHGTLALQGLAELEPAATVTSIDTATLASPYSRVTLASNVNFTSSATDYDYASRRAIIRATSSISAKGLTAPAGQAGGCLGGGPGMAGACNGGGGGNTGGGGGGGAGCATDGGAGSGNGAGPAGPRTGDELLVDYNGLGQTASRSPGGGGGASGLGAGGAGGAGGGLIELTAGGDVSVGAITLNGGAGTAAGFGTGGGGGGGGAGGLVMLRAGGQLMAMSPISVAGGAGVGGGGNGANGRVRWDASTGTAPTLAAPDQGTLHRGPSFIIDNNNNVFRESKPTIMLRGTKGGRGNISTISYLFNHLDPKTDSGPDVIFGDNGLASFMLNLKQGLTQVCLTLAGGSTETSEANTCVFVAFLP
ncbi:MAG TPA: hypothetical protein VGC42_20600 [Kofleriaceae bacterium]